MQEHIKLPLHPDTCSTDGWSTDKQRVLREFAQAVARECADIAEDTIEQGGGLGHHSAKAIRTHFGLEG